MKIQNLNVLSERILYAKKIEKFKSTCLRKQCVGCTLLTCLHTQEIYNHLTRQLYLQLNLNIKMDVKN
jgi:hypothetical protein